MVVINTILFDHFVDLDLGIERFFEKLKAAEKIGFYFKIGA